MQGVKGIIDLTKMFSCRICKNIAYQSFATDCCETIICKACSAFSIKCPTCQTCVKLKKSALLEQIQRNVIIQCPYDCKKSVNFLQIQRHISNCSEAPAICPFCKLNLKICQISEHLEQSHVQQWNRMLNQLQKFKDKSKIQAELKQESLKTQPIKPYKYGTTGQYNIDPRLSRAGRLVCGRVFPQQQLPGQSIVNSSGFFSKHKQNCSVEFGSCDRCMELDVDRLSLPNSYLLNLQGRICNYNSQRRKVACGCSNGRKICNQQLQCAACRRILELIQRGFYKKCL